MTGPRFLARGAQWSDCRTYRYAVHRIWDDALPLLGVIGLNPSTANAFKLDPTLRKVVGFGTRWGMGGFVMLNVFAFVSTDPEGLPRREKAEGPRNLETIMEWVPQCGIVLAAWGGHPSARRAGPEVCQMIHAMGAPMKALRVNKDGTPQHPLYVPYACRPVSYWTRVDDR